MFQIESTAKYRADSVLMCLAVVADNPANLPPFSMMQDGTASVADTAALNATTTWTRAVLGFATQSIGPSATRTPQYKWSLDPAADYRQLEALRCACRWAVFSPDNSCDDCSGILADPREDNSPGAHFGVARHLEQLHPGWLHFDHRLKAPTGACISARYGSTCVWVMPEDMESFNEFVLIMFDIATISLGQNGQPDATASPKILVTLEKMPDTRVCEAGQVQLTPPGQAECAKPFGISTPLDFTTDREIRPDFIPTIQYLLWKKHDVPEKERPMGTTGTCCSELSYSTTWDQWFAMTQPFHNARGSIKPDGKTNPATTPTQMQFRPNAPVRDFILKPLTVQP
jgi:hypothetical protein